MRLITKFSLAFAALAVMTSCSKDEDSDLNATDSLNRDEPNQFMVYVNTNEAFENAIENGTCIGANTAYEVQLKLMNQEGEEWVKEYNYSTDKSLNIETFFEVSTTEEYQVELMLNNNVVFEQELLIYGYPIHDEKIREKQKDHLEITIALDEVHAPC